MVGLSAQFWINLLLTLCVFWRGGAAWKRCVPCAARSLPPNPPSLPSPVPPLDPHSLGWIPAQVVEVSSDVSRWCLVISIAALGVKTSFEKLAALGWKPIVLLSSETLFIAFYMLAIVFLTRLLSA